MQHPEQGGAGEPPPNPYPTLPAESALARNPEPAGPGSFWYPIDPGRACIYVPDAAAPCYTVVGDGGGPGAAAVDPGAVAATLVNRLALTAGRINVSPASAAVTGVGSWFWLDPALDAEQLSVSLAGETVTVTAQPSEVEWSFGDGRGVTGGAGVAYRPGPAPAGAVVHVYETRCLPGDAGRNPHVLASCGPDGYPVEATVVWRISFTAVGPVATSGVLASRTTSTSRVLPVSEVRGFLVGAHG